MSKFKTKYGHFTEEGSEYVITDPRTPKPWINVISNGSYGLVISQAGGGFSWKQHSEFNRITRWHQDLIQDNWGKFFYFKDNNTGEVWSPTWIPVKAELDEYKCIHGFGYTKFISSYKQINVEATVFVPFEDDIEIWDFVIKNKSDLEVDITIINYFEWVLGSSNDYHREFHKQFLETNYSVKLNGIIAKKRLWDIPLGDRGHWNIDYSYQAYFLCNKKVSQYECDKESFIGNYGNIENPKAVQTGNLTGKSGKFLDSIASLKVDVKVLPGNNERINYYLGLAESENEISNTVNKYWDSNSVDTSFQNVKNRWDEILGNLQIETPDEAMNLMINKWSRYQAISGRIWGRTAYYQQSGAYGYRDQLQDSLAFLPINPELTAEQIRLHARHQFTDGTVLHWWHPISETGLVTRMTDDLLWLPFVVSQYIQETNSYDLLDEVEIFHDNKEKKATIYTHCALAIEKVLERFSERGLPLIGEGDWNDGMSAVGLNMQGESIWLAEFLFYILNEFINISIVREEKELADRYKKRAEQLKDVFESIAWDGEWFFRATKDSGEKIGSKECKEGMIYLNPQTWSVISDITSVERKKIAMNSVSKYLYKDNGTLLLQPAYSKPDKYIGYLSRYAEGRRENGGVYSHASTWSIWAYSLMNDSEMAYGVFKKLCPIYSGMDPDKYAAEPYVLPGNIDGPDSPNYGMAGWTWYTGSASWYQKVVVDWILGIRALQVGLIIDPKIPKSWKQFTICRKFRGTFYKIYINNENEVSFGISSIELDGEEINTNVITKSTRRESTINVIMGVPCLDFIYVTN